MTAYIRFLQNGMPIQSAVRSGAHAGWSELLGFNMGGRTRASQLGPGVYRSRDAGQAWALAPELHEVTITKPMDASSSALMLAAANTYQGSTTVQSGTTRPGVGVHVFLCPSDVRIAARNVATRQGGGAYVAVGDLAAEVDFAEAGGRAAGLRFRIHGIRIVEFQRHGTAKGSVFKVVVDPRASRAGDDRPTEAITMNFNKITFSGVPAGGPDISQLVQARAAAARAGRHHSGGMLVGLADGSVRGVR